MEPSVWYDFSAAACVQCPRRACRLVLTKEPLSLSTKIRYTQAREARNRSLTQRAMVRGRGLRENDTDHSGSRSRNRSTAPCLQARLLSNTASSTGHKLNLFRARSPHDNPHSYLSGLDRSCGCKMGRPTPAISTPRSSLQACARKAWTR